VEVPYTLIDQVCRYDFDTKQPEKISEFLLKARSQPTEVGSRFNSVEIVMMPDFLFNPDTGIRSQLYHRLDLEHPQTFLEFKDWLRQEFVRLSLHQAQDQQKETMLAAQKKIPTEDAKPLKPRSKL